MEWRHLRYFVAVAEQGSVPAASERIHVTQPALPRFKDIVRQCIADGESQAGRKENSPTWRGIIASKREYMAAARIQQQKRLRNAPA